MRVDHRPVSFDGCVGIAIGGVLALLFAAGARGKRLSSAGSHRSAP
jgi:hypothetical protein